MLHHVMTRDQTNTGPCVFERRFTHATLNEREVQPGSFTSETDFHEAVSQKRRALLDPGQG